MKNSKKIIIGFLCVLVLAIIILFAFSPTKEDAKKYYGGKWELQTKNVFVDAETDMSIGEVPEQVLLDDVLDIKEDNVFRGMFSVVCPSEIPLTKRCDEVPIQVYLSDSDNIVGINFITTYGYSTLLCFEKVDKETIKQISCNNSNEYNYNLGINKDYDIIYKKVQ